MTKTSKTARVYITIEVDEPWCPANEHTWAQRGKQKSDEVKRLLEASGLDGLGNVGYEVERPLRCSFCEDPWEDDPACCQEAMDEWALEHPGCPND